MIQNRLTFTQKKTFARLSLVLVWMVAIFLLSNEPANQSSLRSGKVVGFLDQHVVFGTESISTFLVRKSAHIFMFFVLGILIHALMQSFSLPRKKRIAYGVLIAFCYAVFDELHQMFVPGRSGEVRDIMIDTIGASIGILLSYTIMKRLTKRANCKSQSQERVPTTE